MAEEKTIREWISERHKLSALISESEARRKELDQRILSVMTEKTETHGTWKVTRVDGESKTVQAAKLALLGVPTETIEAATLRTPWKSIRVSHA